MSSEYYLVGYFALLFGIVWLLLFLRRRSRQERAPFPENTRLVRGPGESLARKLSDLEDKLLNQLALACVLPALALGVFF